MSGILVSLSAVQVAAAVGITGWLSWRNGQRAVEDVANQLQERITRQVRDHLDGYLATPHQIIALMADAYEHGQVDPDRPDEALRFLWRIAREFKGVSYLNYGFEDRRFVGAGRADIRSDRIVYETEAPGDPATLVQYAVDGAGKRGGETKRAPFGDLREQVWYKEPRAAAHSIWTQVYTWEDNPEIMVIAAGKRIADREGRVVGVAGIDLLLANIQTFLRSLEISPGSRIFVVERTGALIAGSSDELPFSLVEGHARRIRLADSADPLLRECARTIEERVGRLDALAQGQVLDVSLDGARHLLRVSPWHDSHGLDLVIGIATPIRDFDRAIEANTRETLLFCAVALAGALAFGLWSARLVARPVLALSAAARAVEQGDLTARVAPAEIDELDRLGFTFNRMTDRLRELFERLDRAKQELEQRVAERTADLTRAKDAAEVANIAKTRFLATMSHELRTPLNVILGFSQLLQLDPALDGTHRDQIDYINRSGEHLLGLIDDVLAISKIEAGGAKLKEAPFALAELVRGVDKMVRARAHARGLVLAIELAPDLPAAVTGDAAKLRQILLNLLTNAIKFTDKGTVSLSVRALARADDPTGIDLMCEVRDTGAGLSAAELARLFTAFAQPGPGELRPGGSGLGLFICKQYAELMGGWIGATSEPGQGTTFRFNVPVRATTAPGSAAAEPATRIPRLAEGAAKPLVLVAEDQADNRELLSTLLERAGFRVIEAKDGEEAVALWESARPALVWMDMQMPGMSGGDATRAIRSRPGGQDAVIVAITASAFDEDREAILAAGCNDFIRKPFHARSITDALVRHLAVELE